MLRNRPPEQFALTRRVGVRFRLRQTPCQYIVFLACLPVFFLQQGDPLRLLVDHALQPAAKNIGSPFSPIGFTQLILPPEHADAGDDSPVMPCPPWRMPFA